jgi:hypothetical protein
MNHWTGARTAALASAESSLKTVDNLLSFVKEGQGKPSAKERAIFAASVVFLYGIWENYVEQLAMELVGNLSTAIPPERIPDLVRRSLEKKSAWELAITPGWRSLWVQSVKVSAVGDDGERFGMNTARAGQVKNLLANCGAPDPFSTTPTNIIPSHIGSEVTTVPEAVNSLVELRGEIVHTGQVPTSLRKAHVLDWKDFVKGLCESVDSAARAQCRTLTS